MKTFIVILLFCCLQNIFAQTHSFKVYGLEQGLPQSEAWDMYADRRGYLWVGTNGTGVAKFNGKTFQVFNKKDGLPNEQVTRIAEDATGNIWLMTFNGLAKYDGYTFKVFGKEDGIEDNAPFAQFANDDAGVLWFLQFRPQQSNKMMLYKDEKLVEVHTILPALKNLNIWSMTNTKEGILLNTVDINKPIFQTYLYAKGTLKIVEYPINNKLPNQFIAPFFEDMQGYTWAYLLQPQAPNPPQIIKLLKIKKQEIIELPLPKTGNLNIFAIRIIQDRQQNVWTTLQGTGGVACYTLDNQLIVFSEKNGLPTNHINGVAKDVEGNVWVTIRGSGILRYNGSHFTTINQLTGLQTEVVRTFYQDEQNHIWIGTVGNDLYEWDGAKLTSYTPPFPLGRIMKIFPMPNKSLLLATNAGLYQFKDKKFSPAHQNYGLPAGIAFTYILQSKDGDFWFTTFGNGAFKYEPKSKTLTQYNVANKKLQNNVAFSVSEDSKGNIWVVSNGGLHRIEPKNLLQKESEERITVFTKENGLGENLTQQVAEDKNKNIWVTTFGGGISRLEGNRFIPYNAENSKIPSNLVYSIINDKVGNLWIGSQNGVSKLSLDGKSELTDVQNYTVNDGFAGIEPNGVANFVDKDNNVWFGTIKGAVQYNPKHDVPMNKAPLIYITGLRLFFKEVKWAEEPHKNMIDKLTAWFVALPQKLNLPYNDNHVSFDFEAVAFQHTDKVKFQWKLEGIDNNWTPPIQKNEAVYPNLPAGNYTFRVKSGIEEQNIWSNEAIYSFRISPPWWKTWWFISACVLAVSLLIYSFVRIRLKAIKAQQVELERLVLEKTAEIRQQNTEILAQAETLQQANSQIMRQAELLTQKNKDITASINYAKRIQTAMLPNENDIRAVLPNSFILFKPKDIVSGDFYYFAEIKEEGTNSNLQSKIILAAIDCTGHGVPGAFMSMIGNDLLNHIVLEKGLLRPNMILEELHKGVRKSLKQAENKVRDGMDLSLILIDKAQESIEFSGAMNPLYYVQNGVFHEIKGDKKPIGGFQDHDVAYRTHLISIAEPTTIYLCSDGYQDQFSPEGKKFMVRKFKELLFAIQEKGMEEQKNILTEKINLWVGDTKQIDDILVIGVRF